MSTLKERHRSHRQVARHARALRSAMSSITSRAVRDEMLSTLGR
jgi:hypothetical protein